MNPLKVARIGWGWYVQPLAKSKGTTEVDRSAIRDISRGSLFLGLEQLTQVIFGTLYSMAILRLLGPSLYGILTLGLALAGMAGIATLNLDNYLERFVAEFQASNRSHVIRNVVGKVFAVKGSLALLAVVAVSLLASLIARAYDKPDLGRVLPAVAWMILLEAVWQVLRSSLFGLQRYKLIWILALINNLSKMVMVALVAALHGGVVELAWGLIAVVGLATAVAAILVLRILPRGEKRPEAPAPTYREMWRYVLPLLGARTFYLAGQNLNRVILGAFLSSRELGLISFVLVATERFVAMAHAVPLSFLPSMSRLKGLKDDAAIERILVTGFRLTATLALILAVALFTLAREIIVVLGGFEYMDALPALQLISLVYLFRTLNQPLTMTFYTFEKTRIVFWLAGLKLVVELALYPVLLPILGIAGVAVAVVVSSVAVFLPAMAAVGGIFPHSQPARWSVALRTWAVAGLLVVLAVGIQSFVPLIWPSLLARINLVLLGLTASIVLVRLIRSEDVARLRSEVSASAPHRILAGMEAFLQRAEGFLG
ncbi:MAG: oligosaccharide flippase family protein [Candidatus Eisenbacteria bacterium]|nr:oligosaccharide flippase family protein [Candidatus Eisenbacteria bacterium]